MPTGQVIHSAAPVAELLRRVQGRAAAADVADRRARPARLPGGVSNTTHGEGVRRGIGYAIGFKNVGFSEGFDDYSTARVRLEIDRRRAGRHGPHRGRRGRAGPGHRAWPRSRAPSSASIRSSTIRPTPGRQRRFVLGVTADLLHRRRGQAGLRGRARRAARAGGRRRASRTGCPRRRRVTPHVADVLGERRDRAHPRVPPPADRSADPRADRDGDSARATRTCSSRSPRTGWSPTSTSSSAWSGSSRSPPRRTSARR